MITLTSFALLLTSEVSAMVNEFAKPVLWIQDFPTILFYLMAFAACIFLIIRFGIKRNKTIKQKEYLRQIQANQPKEDQNKTFELQDEQKIVGHENERVKLEKLHRDKELANQTMDLIRKNKFLVKITEELDKINRLSSDESINNKINALILKINKEIDNEKQWEVFETAFDDVHEDFLKRLKQKYPSLTPKELKLCAYLRLNISTKELAPLMNISIRGIEICRYRVRKKLDINRDESLTKIIMDL